MWKTIKGLPRKPVLMLIKAYQMTLSPDHGFFKAIFRYGYCRYKPTCSEYGYEVIKKHGLIKGIPLTVWRIMRCNPCSKGGYDPVH